MEEQKKTQGEAGGDSLFDGGFDTAVPERPWATLKRLWHTAQDQHLRLLVVVLSVVCYTALAIAAPYYSAGIVDLLWENIQRAQGLGEAFVVTWRQGGREIFVLLLLYLGSWGFYTLQSYLMVGFAEQLNLRLRREMSEKLHRLPLSYLDSHQTGATLSHFTNDMDKMSEAMQYGILRLVTSVVLIVGSVVMMFRFNVVMTLLFLVFTLLSMVVTKLFSGVTLRRASRRQQALSQVTGLVEEAYSGRVVIKAFCREQASAGEIHRATEELAQATEKADFMMNAINPTVRLVNRLGQMGIAVFAGWQLLSGQLTVGVFQAFFMVVRIMMLIAGTFLLTYTTSPILLTDGLESLMNPLKKIRVPVHELSMMMSIALRFIPTLIEETDKIMSAQRARGADFESGNLIQRAKALIPLLVPLFISAFRRADELAVAMECRCYHGGEGRTRLRQLKYQARDYMVLAFFLAVAVGVGVLAHIGL